MMVKLCEIATKVYNAPFRQKLRLIMARNDYMIEESNGAFYQVEYNLIAASLGPLCQKTRKVHKTLNHLTESKDLNVPASLNNTEPFIQAFKSAVEAYGKKNAVIVAIADNGTNIFDHLFPFEDLEASG